jgi:hypothetical protein
VERGLKGGRTERKGYNKGRGRSRTRIERGAKGDESRITGKEEGKER